GWYSPGAPGSLLIAVLHPDQWGRDRNPCRRTANPPRWDERFRTGHSRVATSVAQYVRTMSAPALRIPVRVSRIARSRSIQPFAAAASIIAYSPETWYAATGTSDAS